MSTLSFPGSRAYAHESYHDSSAPRMAWGASNSTNVSDDDSDEDAWDEVDVEQDNRASTLAAAAAAAAAGTEAIEIVISKGGKKAKGAK